MNIQIILAGVGGQGILFSTKILSDVARGMGYDIIGSETHGMAQRGGSVISHLKIGDFRSPLVRSGAADILYSFEKNETFRNLHFLKENGLCIINSDKEDFFPENIRRYIEEKNVRTYSLNADKIALEMGTPIVSNLILLGFSTSCPDISFKEELIIDALKRVSPKRFLDLNIQAVRRGSRE